MVIWHIQKHVWSFLPIFFNGQAKIQHLECNLYYNVTLDDIPHLVQVEYMFKNYKSNSYEYNSVVKIL